jgi:L-threonylcarbamoyladenylate synthase
LEEAAGLIANGELVAFPTETVYGLGANAFNEEALKRIYITKKRPLTDPIIVHVLDAGQGEQLVIMNEKERKVFSLLTKQFWPGPLTVILQANLELLPMMVTAQTGFVGIRAPKHPYARSLI